MWGGEQKEGEKKGREMYNGEEQEIEGTCNKRQQRKREARASGADKEKTGGRGEKEKTKM